MCQLNADTAECNQSAEFKHICLCGGCITADSWPSFINQAWINSELMSHVTSRVLRVLVSLLAHKDAFTAVQIQFFPIPLIRMHIFVFGRCVNSGRNNKGFSSEMDASKSPHCVTIPNRCCSSCYHLQALALISL